MSGERAYPERGLQHGIIFALQPLGQRDDVHDNAESLLPRLRMVEARHTVELYLRSKRYDETDLEAQRMGFQVWV